MISLLKASGSGYFINYLGEMIYDGSIVHSTGNNNAIFKIYNIRETVCAYDYKDSLNKNWMRGSQNYSIENAKTIFVYHDPKNKLGKIVIDD